jgi:hypothetical protein
MQRDPAFIVRRDHTMVVITILACQLGTAAENPPAGAVLMVEGDVWAVRDGVEQRLSTGDLVGSDDILKTAAGGMVVLQLRNQHLVRLDEDLSLPVTGLALYGAGPSTVAPDVQLAALLYDGETPPDDGFERIAGWQARKMAATSISSAERSAPGAPAEQGKKEAVAAAEEASSGWLDEDLDMEEERADATPSPPPAPPPAEIPPSSEDDAGGGLSFKQKAPGSRPGKRTPTPRRGLSLGELQETKAGGEPYGGTARSEAVPEPVVAPLPDPLLDASGRCLVDWYAGLQLPPGDLEVELVVAEDRTIRRVRAAGGLTLPPCARDPLVGRQLPAGSPRTLTLTFE